MEKIILVETRVNILLPQNLSSVIRIAGTKLIAVTGLSNQNS